MGECPRCRVFVLGSLCAQCGWQEGAYDDRPVASPPVIPTTDWFDSGPAWEARDHESRYDATPAREPTGEAPPLNEVVASHAAQARVERRPQRRRWEALRLAGTVEQVDQPRVETVSLAGHQLAQSAASGCLTAPFRAMGILAGILFAPLRFLLIPSLMSGPRNQGPDALTVPINTFLLSSDDGETHDCMLRGELRGGALRHGDHVEIEGRRDGHGVVRVSALTNSRTGAVTTAYVDPRARGTAGRMVLSVGLLVLVVILIIGALS